MKYRSVFFIACLSTFWLVVVGCRNAVAAELDLSDLSSISSTMLTFIKDVDAVVKAVFLNPKLSGFIDTEWQFFSILLICWLIVDWIFRSATVRDFVAAVLLISITKIMLGYYDDLTTAFWGWSVGFAEGIQLAAVGNTDLFFLPSYLVNLVKSMSFSGVYLLTDTWAVIVASTVGLILSVILGVAAVATATWSIWGYAIAKMIGWMFIPTLMFRRLEWLFEGWLRFFFGFLIYNVIARVNLVLVALVMKALMGGSAISPTTMQPVQVKLDGASDIMGLACFLLIGTAALLSTGRFAMTLAGGGHGGGGGGVLRGLVSFATKGIK